MNETLRDIRGRVTRDARGHLVGSGNLLTTLLPKRFDDRASLPAPFFFRC